MHGDRSFGRRAEWLKAELSPLVLTPVPSRRENSGLRIALSPRYGRTDVGRLYPIYQEGSWRPLQLLRSLGS